MWVKKLDVEELGVTFMPRSMDPLDKQYNKYDNMVEDEEEFDAVPLTVVDDTDGDMARAAEEFVKNKE